MMKPKELPINCAARNAVWIYDGLVPPRFDGAPAMVERRRSHERPDFGKLPAEADIAVELYGGAIMLRLDGVRRRVHTGKFDYASYRSDEEVRHALLTLWRVIEHLESAAKVEEAAAARLRQQTGST